MIDLRYLRHFLAVASHPTVQAAADAIHITQPALTKSIARFEEDLDEKLFDRKGHKLVLTELGERLVERGEELLRHVHDLEEEVALWKGMQTGEIRVGVDPVAELSLLPPVLEAFVPVHPGINVTIRSGHGDSLLPQLLRGELHFLIAEADIAFENEDLEVHELFEEEIALAVRNGHALLGEPHSAMKDFSKYLIASATRIPRVTLWAAEQARHQGIDPLPQKLTCDNYEVLVRLVEISDTIISGPHSVIKTFEQTGRVTVIPFPFEQGPVLHPSLIRSVGRHLSPAVEKFIQILLEQYAK